MTNTWGGQGSASSIMASFSLASNGTAGVTYDNAVDGGNNGGSTASLTYPYTVGSGGNRLLIVNLIGDNVADDISSVTYAGTAMTLIGKVQAPSNNNWQYLYSSSLNPGQRIQKQCCHHGAQFALSHLRGSILVQRKAVGPAGCVYDEHGTGHEYFCYYVPDNECQRIVGGAGALVLRASDCRIGRNSDTCRCSHWRSWNIRKQRITSVAAWERQHDNYLGRRAKHWRNYGVFCPRAVEF